MLALGFVSLPEPVIRRFLGAIGCWVMHRESWLNPEALRAARVRAGLTQHELARLVGVAGGERVSRWELGTSRPRPEILLRVASALDVSSTDLLDSNADLSDLRGLRIAAGLSMRDLAARTHLSLGQVVERDQIGGEETLSKGHVTIMDDEPTHHVRPSGLTYASAGHPRRLVSFGGLTRSVPDGGEQPRNRGRIGHRSGGRSLSLAYSHAVLGPDHPTVFAGPKTPRLPPAT
jgi:transcriptional regulator with XRE-family HTH domain